MQPHLICHSGIGSYYIPLDFEDPIFLPEESDVCGDGIVGSSYRLRDELQEFASSIGIILDTRNRPVGPLNMVMRLGMWLMWPMQSLTLLELCWRHFQESWDLPRSESISILGNDGAMVVNNVRDPARKEYCYKMGL